ncbi:hypothetical protein [Nonomuraea wenchangensis]|uniref:hypothetical protein n=1 Tax=Nonomuraea wenchangensis TaxID=568860 RepID=UPI0033212E5F
MRVNAIDHRSARSPSAYEQLVAEIPSREIAASPHTLWTVNPLAAPHLGLDKLIVHQRWLIDAGADHTILIADICAKLTAGPRAVPIEQRVVRYEHYLSRACGLPATILRGSSFQQSTSYQQRLAEITAARQPCHNRADNIEPSAVQAAMHTLDPEFLGVDAILLDHLQAPTMPGRYLSQGRQVIVITAGICRDNRGRPLHESTPRTRITIQDDAATLTCKVKQMLMPSPKESLEGAINPVLEHFRWSVFPWTDEAVPVHMASGGYSFFHSQTELAMAYHKGRIQPSDAKTALLIMLSARLQKIQTLLQTQCGSASEHSGKVED